MRPCHSFDDSEYTASEDMGYEEDASEESGYDASEVEAEDALYEEETGTRIRIVKF